MDLGFERAGWSTLSLSEIEPYACAVLAERFPAAPNLGDITTIDPEDIPDATVWTGGFPCQDLSKAGKRLGFGGDRSVLAFAFLDLVERRRPPWFVLENVDGLLTSNDGRDLARLVREVDALRYGLAWRVLDAQWFGVAQRRRRVFLIGSRDSDRAGAVLLDGDRGRGDPPPSVASRSRTSSVSRRSTDGARGPDVAGALSIGGHVGIQPNGQDAWTGQLVVVGSSPHPDRVRAVDGLARRMDDRSRMETAEVSPTLQAPRTGGYRYDADQAERLAVVGLGVDGPGIPSATTSPSLRSGGGGQGDTIPLVFRKSRKAQSVDDHERWVETDRTDTISPMTIGSTAIVSDAVRDDPDGLPVGFDTHRYRLTGNGVVAPVAEWIARRIRAEIEKETR